MPKLWLLFFLLCGALSPIELLYAQTSITNEVTPAHQLIAGTKMSVVVPSGFEAATSFTGLQNLETQSTIMIMEVSTAFEQYIAQAIPMVIKNDKSTMIERAQYTINNLPARLYVGTQKGDTDSAMVSRIFLVLGNDQETIVFNCHYPYPSNQDVEDQITKTILSAIYHPDILVDPLQNMGFTISTKGTSFRFSRKTGSALQYTQEAKNNWSPGAFFIDRKSLPTAISDHTTFITNQVKAIFDVDNILFSRSLQVNDLPAQEVMANMRNKKNGELMQVYFLTLFDTNKAYSMIGYNINAKAMEEMKTIFRSLEIH